MRSVIVDAGSKQSDIWGLLQGTWNEYDQGGWHIVKTPFFLVLKATAEEGGMPLPFRFKEPVAGILYFGDGTVQSIIVRPGENSVSIPRTCIVKFQLFGNEAETAGVI